MKRLINISSANDIPPFLRDTPVGRLLEYQNLGRSFDTYVNAGLLIGMCMDHRKQLRIPENFAYIIRTGGGNLRYSEFKVSYAISIGNIKTIALIGHDNCGMVNLFSKKGKFIDGLVETAGWDREWAKEHFMHFAPLFEIGNEIDFVLSEAKRLRMRYPKIAVIPLFYKLKNNLLYLINEG